MNAVVDFLIIGVLLLNLVMLSSSRIGTCIRIMAVQGSIVGFLPFIVHHALAPGVIASSCMSIVLKGIVFPWLLFRALREAHIQKEVEPVGGYPVSVAVGVIFFIASYWMSARLEFSAPLATDVAVPVACATFLTGAFIIVSRMKAITQVIGYLVLENGIYLFGAVVLAEQSLLVELAILLDIFVGVFVMGIAIFHINREFDHIDTRQLSQLKDWVEPGGDS